MLTPIQQKYYAWDISHKKSVTDDSRFTGVLSEARVDLNPHQVEAALFAFKSPLSKGAILADEVGLGKTIEACIILSEMWAENKRDIMIVVPASLRNQWNIELMEKFYLPSFILDKNSFQEGVELNKRGEKTIYICSYNFAVTYHERLKSIDWDLIVMDEAHKLRNVYKKSNVMANIIRATFRDYKKVLLTATPLQNNLKELYGLISIIDPEYFSSLDTFAEQYNTISTRDKAKYGELKGRISHIIHRTLRNQVQEYVNFTKRTAFVQEYTPSAKETKLYEFITEYLHREGTYGVPEKQRSLLTLLVTKILSSSSYALSFTLDRFIERLKMYKNTGKMISILDNLNEDNEESYVDDYPSDDNEYDIKSCGDIDDEIRELIGYRNLAQSISKESKAVQLLKALSISFERIENLGGNKKALIFTESRRTQEYLFNFLENNGYKDKVVCFNGSNDSNAAKNIYHLWLMRYAGTNRISGSTVIDKKQSIVDAFKDDAEILIATEAGAEGINLQFCSLVVNYDMPWNPQRIEQRIGRCHRYGQKNDVVVVNFVNQSNRADCRVYELLNNKFSLFDGVFGASDEVLGALDSGVDFERRINNIYQTCRTEREIEAAFDELQQELDTIIKERIDNTRKTLLENFDEEVVDKLRVRQIEDSERLNVYNRHLWKLAISVLDDSIAHVDEKKHTFVLTKEISNDIPTGTYILNKDSDQFYQLRFGHPLGQYIISKAAAIEAHDVDITFDLSAFPYKSSLVEQYKGKSGEAVIYKITTFNKYDSEENLIACAVDDRGITLPSQLAFKLLEIPANTCVDCNLGQSDDKFKSDLDSQLTQYTTDIEKRTNEYVDFEINKYEMWADDQLVPLRNEVMELSREHDQLRRQIRKEHNASVKIQLKKDEAALAKKLHSKRSQLLILEDEYMEKVDEMTERLQKTMNNKVDCSVMFRFKWSII